jgi:acyl-coenzyme A thioesterase PaaI-like protein
MSNESDSPFGTFPTFHQRDGELSDSDIARVRLADAMRRLMREAFTSHASATDIDVVAEQIEQQLAVLHGSTQVSGSAASDSHFSDRSPIYGAMNPLSMPMTMGLVDGGGEFGSVTGEAVFTELYEGPPGHCHGGFIAAAFDEVLGMAQSLTGRPGMTGKLAITYRAPTPLHTPIHFVGWVEKVEGRKIFTKGTAHNGDTLCAESEGLFLSMPTELMERLKKGRDLKNPTVGE